MSPRRGALALAAILAALQAGLLVGAAWDKSHTADEGVHVTAAATLWANRDFRFNCEAPVLPKWGFAVALRTIDPHLGVTPSGWVPPFQQRLLERSAAAVRDDLHAARVATILVVVAAGLVLWCAAMRFGTAAATVTHTLWCLSPTVLANGSLATLDGWSAALVCAGIWAAVRLVERPNAVRSAVLGAMLAGAAASKVTTLGLLPVALALLWWTAKDEPRAGVATLRRSAAFAAGFLVVMWALYGFSLGPLDFVDPCAGRARGAAPSDAPLPWAAETMLSRLMLPFPAWFEGLVFQLQHAETGHTGYLFGEVRADGWWWFYLACCALKLTVAVQVLILLCAVACGTIRGRGTWRIDAILLAYPLVLLVVMSAARHQGNIGFLLPAFPLVMVWLGAGVDRMGRAFGRRTVVVVALVLAIGAWESLRVHPHHLMFFNFWAGGPEGGPRYLVHREDWGQDKRRLAEWQREHRVARLYYAPYGFGAESWGVVYDPVPCEPRPGVYALHAVEVHRPRFSLRPGCIDWLTVEPPDERLGYSIYLYTVDDGRLARLAAARATATPFWKSQ